MTSILLAQILGLSISLLCLSLLLRRRAFTESVLNLENNSFFVYFAGAISLLVGTVIVVLHNIWTLDYRGVITLIGYFSILKGLLRIFLARMIPGIARKLIESDWFVYIMVFFLAIGLYLIKMGFGL